MYTFSCFTFPVCNATFLNLKKCFRRAFLRCFQWKCFCQKQKPHAFLKSREVMITKRFLLNLNLLLRFSQTLKCEVTVDLREHVLVVQNSLFLILSGKAKSPENDIFSNCNAQNSLWNCKYLKISYKHRMCIMFLAKPIDNLDLFD